MVEAIDMVLRKAQENGIVAGIHANAGLAVRHRDAGYQMITVYQDLVALNATAAADIDRARQ